MNPGIDENVSKNIFDLILHVDKYLAMLASSLGVWTYVALFAVIFVETGLVVMPFLPGDSLLFASGALAASTGSLNIILLFIVFSLAAVIGDSVNYSIGKRLGKKAYEINNRFIKREYLEKAQRFYHKHGGKAIILSRFVPIVRTFAPFIAGIGEMHYTTFLSYNIVGGLAWVSLFLWSGYLFGNVPFVKHNFEIVIVIIVLISVVPMVYEYIKHKRQSKGAITELKN